MASLPRAFLHSSCSPNFRMNSAASLGYGQGAVGPAFWCPELPGVLLISQCWTLSCWVLLSALIRLLTVFSLRGSLVQITVINMMLLFLGGRTNFIADYFGIPLHIYHFAHRCLGRVVIAQAIVHAAINFSSRPDRLRLIIGLVAANLLVTNLFASILPLRRYAPSMFRMTHRVLCLGSLGSIFVHIFALRPTLTSLASILSLTAIGSFTTSCVLRLGRIWYHRKAETMELDSVGDAVRLRVRTRHSVQACPGTYFYLSFPSLPWRHRLQSHPTPVAFWDSKARD